MKSSRRHFLQSALAVPLTAAIRPSGVRALGLLIQEANEAMFSNPYLIRYDASCFTLRNEDAFIYSAAFHYPRCPQPLWRDRLSKLKLAGYNTIETYVFWNYHEPAEGRADLGEFGSFIRLVKEMGFWMIARPGPYVCAEWDAGGFPHWVIAKRFPLRSNHPESLRTSEHWFSLVLPVIQRYQITHGGPIIMVQLENEYDYWPTTPDAEKMAYLRALAGMAWNQGIDVPLITCWTKQARENSDATMAEIMDTCNFYPRWKIVEEVPPRLEKLRQEEPATPLGVTEMQGGWFSEFGGRLSVDQEGVDAAQYNMIAKTVIEQGATYLNTYMAFGGTNFDWAAKTMTTTYDYAAPLREPGGLWEKYYAARGIGASLGMLGRVLARANRPASGVACSNPNVTVSTREKGPSGALFIRENTGAEQRFKMSFPDPASPTRRPIQVPREGELLIGAHEMKMSPIQMQIPGGALRYSTAEVLAHGESQERQFLILYDEPGRLVEVGLATRDEPHVEGETVYQYWDQEYESVVVGVRIEKNEKILILNNHLMIFLLPRRLALETWTADFPQQMVPGPFVEKGEKTQPISVPFVSDAALLEATASGKHALRADLVYRPGGHDLLMLLPPLPAKCRVDGAPADFQYDRHLHTARVQVTTPALPSLPVTPGPLRFWIEKAAQLGAEVLTSPVRPLEELGPIPYGYVKYSALFSYAGEPKMFISTFADDEKKVFLNGKLAHEASSSKKQVEFPLAQYAQPGPVGIEIFYELFGSPNFGENIAELKGIESVTIGSDSDSARPMNPWLIQRRAAAMRGVNIDPEFSIGGWQEVVFSRNVPTNDLVPAFTWCRAEFALEKPPESWQVPFKLVFEASRDALLYLNGKFVGRYVIAGPQKDFYLPEPFLIFEGRRRNVLTVVLAYAEDPSPIRTLRVAPYEEFALNRTRIEFEW